MRKKKSYIHNKCLKSYFITNAGGYPLVIEQSLVRQRQNFKYASFICLGIACT